MDEAFHSLLNQEREETRASVIGAPGENPPTCQRKALRHVNQRKSHVISRFGSYLSLQKSFRVGRAVLDFQT